MIDPFDLFDLIDFPPGPVDIYQSAKIDKVAALEADSFRRLTGTQDRLRELEQRYDALEAT